MNDESELDAIDSSTPPSEDNNYFVYVCAVGILPIKVANYRYI